MVTRTLRHFGRPAASQMWYEENSWLFAERTVVLETEVVLDNQA